MWDKYIVTMGSAEIYTDIYFRMLFLRMLVDV